MSSHRITDAENADIRLKTLKRGEQVLKQVQVLSLSFLDSIKMLHQFKNAIQRCILKTSSSIKK